MLYRNIEIKKVDSYFLTLNLSNVVDFNLKLKSFGNDEGELNVIFFLINYTLNKKPLIRNNQTISYGLWLLKFVEKDGFYNVYELDEKFENWEEGVTSASYYLELQRKICEEEQAEFSVPLFTQKIAVSKGVLEGKIVQGVRYKEPEHMSGWYITTSEYDGNVKNMEVITLQSFVTARKDLLQFLALPPGYVFETTERNTCRIWRLSDFAQNISGN